MTHYSDKCASRVGMSESRRGIRRFIQADGSSYELPSLDAA